MSFESFKSHIADFAQKSGEKITKCGYEEGRYFAGFSSGVRVFGNSIAKSLSVKWPNGHQAYIRVNC